MNSFYFLTSILVQTSLSLVPVFLLLSVGDGQIAMGKTMEHLVLQLEPIGRKGVGKQSREEKRDRQTQTTTVLLVDITLIRE